MPNNGKRLLHSNSENSCFIKRSVAGYLSKNMTSCKDSNGKKSESQRRSQVKRIVSIFSQRKEPSASGSQNLPLKNLKHGANLSGRRSRNSSLNIKRKRRTLQKVYNTNAVKKQSYSKPVFGRTTSSHRENKKQAKSEGNIRRMQKKRKRKKAKENVEQDEASRLQRRTRYLLIKMKMEQTLIDAYSGEGWKGQSREKIKPEKELQRAESQILKCKLGIRDAVHQLDLLSSEGCIEGSVIDPDGSVFHEHIFCAKCKLRDAFPDNDIILCDGACNCAFHQKCLDPPLATENIPPGDQGWLCKFCECKTEILEAVNAHLGTRFSVDNSWEDIFKDAATAHDGNASLNPGEEWPSEDSEDDDYDPDRKDKSCSGTGIEENTSDDSSSSCGSFWSSDEASSQSRGSFGVKKRSRNLNKGDFLDSAVSIDSDNSDYKGFVSCQRRRRKDVDYKKLHDEMFGKDFSENEHSEDEDWGPGRRKRRKESGIDTFVSSCDGEDGCINLEVDRGTYKKLPSNASDKRSSFRMPPNAVEKLRRVFAENELPPRDIKENLSKQLGLASEKVHKWFKNARYTALKIRKGEITERLPGSISKGSNAEFGTDNSSDQAAAKANSHLTPAIGVWIPKNLRKARWRKNPKSLYSPLKKLHKRRLKAPVENQLSSMSLKHTTAKQLELTYSYRQVHSRFKNTVHLKTKQRSGLQEKNSLEKEVSDSTREISNRLNEISDKDQPYFVEMERLFAIEDKLGKMKSKLIMLNLCEDKNHVISETSSNERLVHYVPVVEVIEKV